MSCMHTNNPHISALIAEYVRKDIKFVDECLIALHTQVETFRGLCTLIGHTQGILVETSAGNLGVRCQRCGKVQVASSIPDWQRKCEQAAHLFREEFESIGLSAQVHQQFHEARSQISVFARQLQVTRLFLHSCVDIWEVVFAGYTPSGITQEQIVRVVGFVDRALIDLKHLEPAFDIHHL
jgi:hypothetical protein